MLYLLLCVYIALYYIRPFEWVPGLVGTPIFLWLGVVSILALLLAWGTGTIRLFRFKTDVMMVGFVAAIVLSHLSHGYFGGAIDGVRDFLPAIVGYFLVAHALDSEKKIKGFVFLLTGLTVFLAYQAWLQSVHGVSFGGMEPLIQKYYDEDGVQVGLPRVRWFGMFNDPNDLGLALVLPVPFLLDRLMNRKYLLAGLCLPPLIYALYLTNSRGALLALLASVFTYLVLRFRSIKGVVVGLALAAVLMLFGPSRMAQMSAGEDSAYGRVEAWYAGFQMFKSNPVFGVGKGMFTDFHDLTAHNSFVLVLAELGVVGSFFFLGLFFYPLRWGKLNLFRETESPESEQDRRFLAAGLAAGVGLLASIFFLSRAYILLPFMAFALVMASINIFGGAVQGSNRAEEAPEGFNWSTLCGLVLLQIVAINLIVRLML
jgi:O-antigen ligase